MYFLGSAPGGDENQSVLKKLPCSSSSLKNASILPSGDSAAVLLFSMTSSEDPPAALSDGPQAVVLAEMDAALRAFGRGAAL